MTTQQHGFDQIELKQALLKARRGRTYRSHKPDPQMAQTGRERGSVPDVQAGSRRRLRSPKRRTCPARGRAGQVPG